ncbi:MAG: sn-glycerol-3-phosphate ABC transporter ATP-binding protein UgpC [Actinomycetota bacterium]|nr:sn-glycerol-3-phosphate ABC transporter ATP-binding protein UgpC [Actinomycetota bacterium]
MATVTFDQASRIYPGADYPAVDKLDLEINDGEFMVLVGPSGCGKSTSLRMLAGLEEVNGGNICIGERDVTTLPPKDRDIAMVFQNYALYPHMSVGENMGFALKMAGVSKDERERRVQDAAKLLGLEDFLERKPKALSGGQRQRVAMGRAIVREPQVFLMDEPLSNLDAKLRVSTRAQIAALQRRLGITTVYVTHDQVEAMTMGDRVAVLKDGLLQQVDTPLNLYDKPANSFVAGFIGSPAMNLLKVGVTEGGVRLGNTDVQLRPETRKRLGEESEAIMGVRPESFRVVSENDEGLLAVIDVVEELGADAYVYATLDQGGGSEPIVEQVVAPGTEEPGEDTTTERVELIARVDARKPPTRGSKIRLAVDPERIHLFSSASGERVSN